MQLKSGDATITFTAQGDIEIKGGNIKLTATKDVEITGTNVKITGNSTAGGEELVGGAERRDGEDQCKRCH